MCQELDIMWLRPFSIPWCSLATFLSLSFVYVVKLFLPLLIAFDHLLSDLAFAFTSAGVAGCLDLVSGNL